MDQINQTSPAVQAQFNTPVHAVTSEDLQELKPKSSWVKKIFIGLGILVGLIIIFAGILIPLSLKFLFHDIPPIDDKDLIPKFASIKDQDNMFSDLDGIGNIAYEPNSVKDYIVLTKWDNNDVSQILGKNKDAFTRWDAASKKSSFQDPLYTDPSTPAVYKPGFPHIYSGIQKLARLNTLRGLSQIKSGNIADGLATLIETLTIGQAIQKSDSGLITSMVGISVQLIALNGIQAAAPEMKLSKEVTIALINQLNSFGFYSDGLKESLKQEYFTNSFLTDALSEGKTDKFVAAGVMDTQTQDTYKKYGSLFQIPYFFEPNRSKQLYADFYRAQINEVDLPCPDIKEIRVNKEPLTFSNLYLKENLVGRLLFSIGVVSFDQAITSKCYLGIDLNGTQLILALQAYQKDKGTLPDTLDQLTPVYLTTVPIDPFDNKPLKYLKDKKIIYSVGKDLKDDGGQGAINDSTALDYIISFGFPTQSTLSTSSATAKVTPTTTSTPAKPTATPTPVPQASNFQSNGAQTIETGITADITDAKQVGNTIVTTVIFHNTSTTEQSAAAARLSMYSNIHGTSSGPSYPGISLAPGESKTFTLTYNMLPESPPYTFKYAQLTGGGSILLGTFN